MLFIIWSGEQSTTPGYYSTLNSETMKCKCTTISSEQKINELCWLDIQSGLHFLYIPDMLVKSKTLMLEVGIFWAVRLQAEKTQETSLRISNTSCLYTSPGLLKTRISASLCYTSQQNIRHLSKCLSSKYAPGY